MLCPYCNEEMAKGNILGDRYRLKWMPADKSLALGIWAKDSIMLGECKFGRRPQLEAYFCAKCSKMLIDVKEDK